MAKHAHTSQCKLCSGEPLCLCCNASVYSPTHVSIFGRGIGTINPLSACKDESIMTTTIQQGLHMAKIEGGIIL